MPKFWMLLMKWHSFIDTQQADEKNIFKKHISSILFSIISLICKKLHIFWSVYSLLSYTSCLFILGLIHEIKKHIISFQYFALSSSFLVHSFVNNIVLMPSSGGLQKTNTRKHCKFATNYGKFNIRWSVWNHCHESIKHPTASNNRV